MPFIELTEKFTGQIFHVRTNTINCVIDNGKNTVVQIRGGRMHVEGTVEEILRRINDLELPFFVEPGDV